jgi:hypothetical protein
MIMKILKRNDLYENFEKRGGSREKGGGGNEIHAPCACGNVPYKVPSKYCYFGADSSETLPLQDFEISDWAFIEKFLLKKPLKG